MLIHSEEINMDNNSNNNWDGTNNNNYYNDNVNNNYYDNASGNNMYDNNVSDNIYAGNENNVNSNYYTDSENIANGNFYAGSENNADNEYYTDSEDTTNTPKIKEKKPGQGPAIASLIVSILGLLSVGGCLFIPWMSIISLALAIIASILGNRSGVKTAGYVISIVGIIICIVFYILVYALGVNLS